jgi:hypothetical protein
LTWILNIESYGFIRNSCAKVRLGIKEFARTAAELFKSNIEQIFQGPLKEKSKETKVNCLLLWIVYKGRKIRDTWTDLDGPDQATAKKKFQTYDRFQSHVQPRIPT